MNKRILSLTLALVMILGTFTAVFAAELTVEEEAGRFLEKNGILKGDENGDLLLGENLERRDAVVLLSRLLKVEEEAAAHEFTEEMPSWTDVRTDNYYVPFFAWAQTNEYFEGNEDKTFAPRADITADEYALVLLRALGHKVNGHDSWKAALETAEKEGLLKDVTVESKKAVLRGEMAVMTLNALGQKMVDSDETLADFLGIELPEPPKAEKLEVEEVYTENLAEVMVKLSNAELVNKDKLENPANYRLSGPNAVKVYAAEVIGDEVRLTLVPFGRADRTEVANTMLKGRKYDLTIRNIDTLINKTYKNIEAKDNAIPVVEEVDFIGDYGIKVVTSEPVKNPAERNFRIDDKRTSMIIEQFGRTLILTPYHNSSFNKDAKELVIENLADFAGYNQVKESHDLVLSDDTGLPVVTRALRNGNKLTLEFDRDVFHKSIAGYESRRDLGNVSFVDKRASFHAIGSSDKDLQPVKVATNKVVYNFTREIPRDAEIVVEGVQNHFGKEMERQTVDTVLFADDAAPVIISPVTMKTINYDKKAETEGRVNGAELVLTFDKEDLEGFTDEKGNITNKKDLERHFELFEGEVSATGRRAAEDVKYTAVVKEDKVTLTFNNIKLQNKNKDFDYILEVRNFQDKARNRMETTYIDFQVKDAAEAFDLLTFSKKDTPKEDQVFIEYDSRTNSTELRLQFNEYVNKESAENVKNYFFGKEGKTILANEAIVERDGYTVTLVFYDKTRADIEGYKVLEISPAITNAAGKSVAGSRYIDLVSRKRIDNTLETSKNPIVYMLDDKVVTKEVNVASDKLDKTLYVKVNEDVVVYQYDKNNDLIKKEELTKNAEKSQAIVLDEKTTKVTTKVKGEKVEESIKVNILDNEDKKVKLTIVGSKFTREISGDNLDFKVPYDVDIKNAKFEVEPVKEGLATDVKVEKLDDTLLIKGKTEFGEEFSHKLRLVNAEIDGEKSTFSTDENEGTLKLVDELGEKVVSVEADDMSVYRGNKENKVTEPLKSDAYKVEVVEGEYKITITRENKNTFVGGARVVIGEIEVAVK